MKHTPCDDTSKADEAFRKGRWKDAEDSFQRILQRLPDCVEAWLGLAEVQAVLGQYNSVIESLTSAVGLCESPDRLDTALAILGRILQLNPQHEPSLNKRIDLLFSHQRTAEAIHFSRELAQYYLENDQGELGIRLLVRAFQLNPQDHDLTHVLAEAYLANGQMREASGLFRQLIPKFMEQQEWDKAVNILKRLSLLDAKDPQNHLDAGEIYLRMEKYQEADQQFRAVLRIDLNHREALLKVAQVGLLRKQFRDASTAYTKLITLNSDDAEALEGLGRVYRGQGMQIEAAKQLLLAGLAFADKSNSAKAQDCFKAVLEIDPANNIASSQLKLLALAGRE